MKTCCVKGCDSSKYITLKYYAFFNFPLDNEVLLKKWLDRIDQPDLKPNYHQICSIHFSNDDITWRPNGLPPLLKPMAVPTIFPPQEASPCVAQSNAQTFLVAMPLDTSVKSSNGEINGNYRMPLILIPTQYFFPCQASIPQLIPPQIAAQLQIQSSQINPQNQLQIQPFPQINPQNSLQPYQFPQVNQQNTQQPANAMNPTGSVQLMQQITAQNSSVASECPKMKMQSRENSLQVSHINDLQNSMEISTDLLSNDKDAGVADDTAQDLGQMTQISQTNGHDSAPVFEFPEFLKIPAQRSGRLKNTNLESDSEKGKQICQNSPAKGQSCEAISDNFGIAKTSQIISEARTDEEEQTRKPAAEELSTSWRIFRKIPSKATISLKKEIDEEEIHLTRVTKPDVLIIPKKRKCHDPVFFDQTKTPILRISINKLYNLPSESKYSSEKENSSEERNLSRKSITVENHRTNKSVTYRIDSRTGEIVVENWHILQLPKKSRSKNTGTKRKVDTDGLAQSENLRQLCARSQRECSAFRRILKLLR